MNGLESHHTRAGLAALVLVFGVRWQAVAQRYTLIDLGTVGGPTSAGFSLNDFGQIVGASTAADANLSGFFWDETIQAVAPLAGDQQAHSFDINTAGVIVATSYDLGDLVPHGFSWQNGASTPLGGFAPRGVNDSGVVVGHFRALQPEYGWVEHACLWSNGLLVDLGTLGGHTSQAFDIAPDGWVVGSSTTAADREPHACLWMGGAPVDLGTLGGTAAQAYAINTAGAIVGWSNTAAGVPHAFLYVTDSAGAVTSRTDLGSLPGDYSYAYGLNNHGQVVGTSGARAFVWENGLLTDLNDTIPAALGWRLDAAWAVNDAGQIVGVGRYRGFPRAFLLTPSDCPDFDGNGSVDLADLAVLLAHFGTTSGATFMDGDLDGDADVDLADLAELLANFGTTCP